VFDVQRETRTGSCRGSLDESWDDCSANKEFT
jgi:hypothetical protein